MQCFIEKMAAPLKNTVFNWKMQWSVIKTNGWTCIFIDLDFKDGDKKVLVRQPIIVYLDEILVVAETDEEHMRHQH